MSRFVCTSIGTRLPRRLLLRGLASAALLAPAFASAAGTIGISDLVDEDGVVSDLARKLAGTTLTLRGYYAPTPDELVFDFYERPAAPCQLCGLIHDAGARMSVRSAASADVSMLRMISITGRLLLAPEGPELADASAAFV